MDFPMKFLSTKIPGPDDSAAGIFLSVALLVVAVTGTSAVSPDTPAS